MHHIKRCDRATKTCWKQCFSCLKHLENQMARLVDGHKVRNSKDKSCPLLLAKSSQKMYRKHFLFFRILVTVTWLLPKLKVVYDQNVKTVSSEPTLKRLYYKIVTNRNKTLFKTFCKKFPIKFQNTFFMGNIWNVVRTRKTRCSKMRFN